MVKRKIFAVMLIFTILISSFDVYGASNVSGKILSTDIVAYINGIPIKSYNIDGYTGIVAEDLEKYGFNVEYNNEFRLLRVNYYEEGEKEITADYIPEKNNLPVGAFVSNVYKTDIVTEVNNKEVTSYNIGGRTVILIDSLSCYGDVLWNSEKRTVSFEYVAPWEINIENDYTKDRSKEISDFTVELTTDGQGGFNVSGKNREYLTYMSLGYNKAEGLLFNFSIYMDVNPQTGYILGALNDILNIDKEGNAVEDASIAGDHIKFYINGGYVPVKYVKGGGGNGHSDFYFYLDKEIRSINDIKSFKAEFI